MIDIPTPTYLLQCSDAAVLDAFYGSNYELWCDIRDTENSELGALSQTEDLIATYGDSLVGLVGSARSAESKVVATIGAVRRKAQISYSSTSSDLSDKSVYPYFGRTVPTDSLQARAMVDIVMTPEWRKRTSKRAFLLFTADDYGQSIAALIENYAQMAGLRIVDSRPFSASIDNPIKTNETEHPGGGAAERARLADIKEIVDSLEESKATTFLVASDSSVLVIMREAQRRGLMGKKHLWVGSDSLMQDLVLQGKNQDGESNAALMQGMVGARPVALVGVGGDAFLQRWQAGELANRAEFPSATPNTFSPFTYDAVYLYASAVSSSSTDLRTPPNVSPTMYYALLAAELPTGATGIVKLDSQGDRTFAQYEVVNVNYTVFGAQTLKLNRVGTWLSGSRTGVAWDESNVRLTFELLTFKRFASSGHRSLSVSLGSLIAILMMDVICA